MLAARIPRPRCIMCFRCRIKEQASGKSPIVDSQSTATGELPTTYTFPRFMDLPHDIRCMVYDLLLPGPRIIRIVFEEMPFGTVERVWNNQDVEQEGNFFGPYYEREEHGEYGADLGFPHRGGPLPLYAIRASSPSISGMFFACREAYDVFSRMYSRTAFSTIGAKSLVWFSSKLDTLYIDDWTYDWFYELGKDTALSHLTADFGGIVEKVALEHRVRSEVSWHDYVLEVLTWFDNLEHVTLITPSEGRWEDEELTELVLTEPYFNTFWLSCFYTPKIDEDLQWHLHEWLDTVAELRTGASRLYKALKEEDFKKTIPQFEHKTITTSKLKAETEETCRRYQESKNQYRLRVHLTFPDISDPLEYVVSPTTTVANLLEQFRVSQDLPHYVRFILRRDSTDFEPDSLVLDISKIEEANVFMVNVT